MKNKKIISAAIISLFILSMFSIAVPLVLAQPSLILTPNSGPSGTIVTIAGNGFTAYTYYRVYFDTNNNAGYNYGEPYRTVRADSTGAFTTTLTIPSVPSGTYYIRADAYPYTAPAIASAPFIVRTVWEELLDIQDEISDIENKLDVATRWVSDADLSSAVSNITSAIDSAKNDILAAVDDAKTDILSALSSVKSNITKAIADLDTKLGTFTGTDTVASLLYSIKEKTDNINWSDITTIKGYVDEVESLLKNGTYGLSALNTDLDTILTRIGSATTGPTTVMGKLENIKASIDNIISTIGSIQNIVNTTNTNLGKWFGTGGAYSRTAQFYSGRFVWYTTSSTEEEEVFEANLTKPSQVTISGATDKTSPNDTTVYVYISENGWLWFEVYSYTTIPGRSGLFEWTTTISTPKYIKVTIEAGRPGDSVWLYYTYIQAP